MPTVSLSTGSRLGPYEVVASIGSGGMGEVYRARDPRLGREVALKILPALYTRDPERLRRFELEARAAAALNHPNILAVHDIGADAGQPYVVSELLEGQTLRDALAGGALPARKAIDYGVQAAGGLAAAHDKGIVHRDLKPENLFVTKDGRLKIIDFGLAKLIEARPAPVDATAVPTIATPTDPGVVLGTVGYMAPEQVRGEPSDARCDIFALGAILFEMLTGRRAFSRESAAETMTAILRADPLELPDAERLSAPALQRIVRHCLEKRPDERFQSARDLAFDLETLTDASGIAGSSRSAPARRRWVVAPALAGLVVAAATAAGGFLIGRRAAIGEPPSFQQLTFRRGPVLSARFAADGHTIVYGAGWDNGPTEIYSTQPGSAESRPLGLPSGTEILAVSSRGELAVSLQRRFIGGFVWIGTLARVGLAGGTPRELLEDVQLANWDPGGNDLAIVREVAGHSRLEFPVGKVLYETGGWIGHFRVSPRGDRIAFIDHPIRADDGGIVATVDLAGNKHDLSAGWLSLQGLAWAGDEVWFTGTKTGGARALYAVTLDGRLRPLVRVAGVLTLHDVSRDGGVLMTRDETRLGMAGVQPGDTHERDLSWLDWSLVRDLSKDGRTLLFDETGEGGGPTHGVYLRKMDGSPAVRLGDGIAMGLSPDRKFAISIQEERRALVLLPTGAGRPISVPTGGMVLQRAAWFPDGQHLLVAGNKPGGGIRLYVQAITDSAARPISPEGVSTIRLAISADGRFVAARGPDGQPYLYPVDGGNPKVVSGVTSTELFIRFTEDGRGLLVHERSRLPITIYMVDVSSGERRVFKEINEGAGASGFGVLGFALAPDAGAYAYTYNLLDSALFLVSGVK